MKIAVIKIGSRIAWDARDTSGGNYEARYIIETLHRGGAKIDIYTKILAKDNNPNTFNFYNIEDNFDKINDRKYDALIILNGTINYFGGAESRDQILNYFIINKFVGQIYYIYCDPALVLRQTWGSIKGKEWSSNYKQEDIEITRNDIIYISQPYKLDDVREVISKTEIQVADVIHFPFEKFPCLDNPLSMNDKPNYDLIYGGTMRGNRRIKKMVKYYFGYSDSINVEMFGKINSEDLLNIASKNGNPRPPIYGKSVDAKDYMEKSNDTYTHVVIGDEWYEGRDMPQRCYQSIWASVITLIDIELDPTKRVFGHSDICQKFNYVSNREDVEKRIKAIKSNPSMRKQIIEEQFKAVNFNDKEYSKELVNILRDNKEKYKVTPIQIELHKVHDVTKSIKTLKSKKNKVESKSVDNIIEDLF